MCDGVNYLKTMKQELKCTNSINCWCNLVQYKFKHVTDGECMSPEEMLNIAGNDMSKYDRSYLKELTKQKFIQWED